LGSCSFDDFNINNVDFGSLEEKNRKTTKLAPILADANCTLVCVYMSIILLASNGIYELFRIPYKGSIEALGLSYFAIKKRKECFDNQKAMNSVATMIRFYPALCVFYSEIKRVALFYPP
jgi:hypothetical protein